MPKAVTLEYALRQVLKYLYDPVYLRQSPLVGVFDLSDDADPAEALRGMLEKAIAALRVDVELAPASKSQRNYQILFYRYIQQFTQRDVANQLGISPRHLRREQGAAIRALSAYLQSHYDLPEQLDLATSRSAGRGADKDSRDLDREMVWLGDSLAEHVTQVGPVVEEALHLAKALASKHHVALHYSPMADTPPAAIAQTVLKQVVLNLVTTAIHSAPGGRVSLASSGDHGQVELVVEAAAQAHGPWHPPEQDKLDMTTRLLKLFKGKLIISQKEKPFLATVVLPSAEQIAVLAIEDNADTIQLWERYVKDTRFSLVGVRDPKQTFSTAASLQPALIVLDVMLPEIDGWELLGQLRNHPATSNLPIVVCTVLPQEELALSLGASSFIRKPLTRQGFLSALARQIEASEHA